jgi:hypothetical protein
MRHVITNLEAEEVRMAVPREVERRAAKRDHRAQRVGGRGFDAQLRTARSGRGIDRSNTEPECAGVGRAARVDEREEGRGDVRTVRKGCRPGEGRDGGGAAAPRARACRRRRRWPLRMMGSNRARGGGGDAEPARASMLRPVSRHPSRRLATSRRRSRSKSRLGTGTKRPPPS